MSTIAPVIEEKARLIGDMVTRSLEMSIFKQAEQDLSTHSEAQALIGEIQTKQSNGGDVEDVLDRLETLDVVRRFTIAQENLSEVVSHVTKILTATLSDRLDILAPEAEGGCGGCTAEGCDKATSCDGNDSLCG
ncbi:YlbF family regulator [Tumebacillus sp. ITR2]|uniref:YlbF family regulator n=1 Tax=Tumebacillus amylolyticus TaxID=2801339 RepID=A0ABS1JCI2_9BACL|nr:YlbF family regulator [Tumebacillus amylolyticus]MBL0387981.1 YlbF family regulator [Tumebacillus amylolyticus]